MADDLKRFLYKKLPSVEGLHAIVVSDRDGVPVIKVANDNAPEHALRPGFLSTFALATDQGSKLGLSKIKVSSVTIIPTRWFNSIVYLWW